MRFVFMGDGSARRRLEELSADLPNVEFLDPQPRGIFMDVLAAADVLLLNERSTVLDMSLPSKITSYFCAGRPVVAAVPPSGATRDELVKSGGALIVPSGSPTDLLGALGLVIRDKALSRGLIGNALSYAECNFEKGKLLGRAAEFINSLIP